jgi:hypothetical protein
MDQPKSLLRRLRRRPSPALGVALVALFLAAGGVSYAAVAIPNNSISNAMLKNNSVGNVKLRTNAVSYKKIAPGSVGTVRIDQAEVQERVTGTCATSQAITAVSQQGTVTCAPTLPSEYDSGTGTSVALTSPTTAATVATYSLPGGTSYLVQADPYIKVTPEATGTASEAVTVSCTLAAGTSTAATQTRSVNLTAVQGSGNVRYESIPLEVAEPSSANSSTADVTCTATSSTGAPTIAAQATVFAVQTASNNTATTPGS